MREEMSKNLIFSSIIREKYFENFFKNRFDDAGAAGG